MTSITTPILDLAEPGTATDSASATRTDTSTATIRVLLPGPLRALAHLDGEIDLEIGAPSQRGVIDALETRFPQLKNTLRDAIKDRRRPKIRFYACGKDLSHAGQDDRLPEAVLAGTEPYLIVGAISGG
ncbi:MAG TPA: MoaD/ThiS family protein [Thermomicrobiales bacterium]|nr:MoaD/ThiS family protein [Thermomicrobiales bacterium]